MAPSVFTSGNTPYLFHYRTLSLFLSFHFDHGTASVTDPILSRMQLITRRATAEPQSHQVSLKKINKRAGPDGHPRDRLFAYLSAINRWCESPFYLRIIQIGPRSLCGPIDDQGRRARSRVIARKVVLWPARLAREWSPLFPHQRNISYIYLPFDRTSK